MRLANLEHQEQEGDGKHHRGRDPGVEVWLLIFFGVVQRQNGFLVHDVGGVCVIYVRTE